MSLGRAGRAAFTAAVLAAVGILHAGCGIPSYPSLDAPGIVLQYPNPDSGLEFVFDIPIDNDSTIFEGFEVYYRLYSGTELADNLIERDRQAIINRVTLEQRGYRRFYDTQTTSPLDVSRPLLELTSAQKNDATLDVILDFSTLISSTAPSTYPVAIIDEESIPLARNASSDPKTLTLKGFFPDALATTDADVPSSYVPGSTDSAGSLYVSVYVLSYGNDLPLDPNIYSQPAWAGYIAVPGL